MQLSISSSLFCVVAAFASLTQASTPPGLQPSSNNTLYVVFGGQSALQGRDTPRDITASAPLLGTPTHLYGTYALLMVDYDIPGGTRLLHWLQPGLQSSTIQTNLAGLSQYQLTTQNTSYASYVQPNPPNRAPLSHRYVQLLLNTTNNPNAEAALSRAAGNRTDFDPVRVVGMAGVAVVAGNWFNVTNSAGLSNVTASGTSTGAPASYTGGAERDIGRVGVGGVVCGVAAVVVAAAALL